ncbi:MAG TPA: hypothetical protein VL361_10375 [Candidatus Limnocylindrales bacterium]|jgi:hypothetical protein|nr:hypothetical protein [Candidatus Limnocylindrales bacterium]
MKVIGQKCGWVVAQKERRVLKLLRGHTRDCEHDFVTNTPGTPRQMRGAKIQVEFAPEELSGFEPPIYIAKAEDLAA